MIRLITSFLSDKDILKAPKSKVPVVFMGGDCTDNSWRKDIEDEFGEDLYLLDPFDKNYDPAKNTYKEIAGMINSDYIIFYRGGKQSDREKEFLDLIGCSSNPVKEFDDIDALKKFFRGLRDNKLESISSKIKKCADRLVKEAGLSMSTKSGEQIDLSFEKLDDKSIVNLLNDIFSGKLVTVPVNAENLAPSTTFKVNDIQPDNLNYLLLYAIPGTQPPRTSLPHIIKHVPKRPLESREYTYDTTNRAIVANPQYKVTETERTDVFEPAIAKVAKEDAVYEHSCTMVSLPSDLSEEIINWGKENILDSDLYVEGDESKGREDDIHITLFYGLKSDDPTEVANLISKIKPFDIRLGLINLFKDKEKYDVLKIEIESGELERLHYDIEKNIDVESTYPTYKPHTTICYIKKGAGDKFVGDEFFKGKTFKVDNITFSDGKDVEKKLPLGK